MRYLLAFASAALLLASAPAQDLIAKTDAKSPDDERKAFKLPKGFEAQLIAAEPEIQKPMQMAFDSKGRLWVTTSHLYPWAAKPGEGTDRLYVLSDFDEKGKAKTIKIFDEKLNIPIGVLPLGDGKSVIVSEAGSILKLTDTDGDGKADKREVLYTGFGYRDTHGMTNSFTLMPDGWIYATHGFSNDSKVKGKDGHEIAMNSGNTFRFKADGSRIEIFTHGQVNPFGIAVDPWLNLYTACCHSKPITQLIRGAYYDSFGKPHDGLGYGPYVVNHQHGSTGLCGLVFYGGDHFPKEWSGVMFLGNVVTNRINLDRIEWHGSTPVGKELPDFLSTDDAWFRPADIKLGPDGALYISDFYNKIIGHYEVDLKHPGRDKDRGRLWRIVYTGDKNPAPKMPYADWAKADESALHKDLVSANTTRRLMAFHELVRRAKGGKLEHTLDPDSQKLIFNFDNIELLTTYIGMVKMLDERTDAEGKGEVGYADALKYGAKRDAKERPRFTGLIMRALASKEKWTAEDRGIALTAWKDFPDSVRMRRALVDGFAAHPHSDFVGPLVESIPKIPADDTHMRHAARIALKACLNAEGGFRVPLDTADFHATAVLADVAVATGNPAAVDALANLFRAEKLDKASRQRVAELVGKQARPELWRAIVKHPAEFPAKDRGAVVQDRLDLVQSLLRGERLGKAQRLDDATISAVQSALDDGLEDTSDATRRLAARTISDWVGSGRPLTEIGQKKLVPALEKLFADAKQPTDARLETAEAYLAAAPEKARPQVRGWMASAAFPPDARSRLFGKLLTQPTAADAIWAKDSLKTAPYSLALALATGLAGDKFGADLLLLSIKAGEAPARLLQEKTVVDRLRATKVKDLDARIADLTKGIAAPEKRIDDLIKKRGDGFKNFKADLAKGKEVFAKNCAVCHQINNEGAKVGPQLDGVGIRGLERLLEDTLDPNRNVDAAFKATTLQLIDGRSPTGLVREEGAVYVLVDALGKEERIPAKDVDKVVKSNISAMPANVDAIIPEAEYYHLLAYLLSQRPK